MNTNKQSVSQRLLRVKEAALYLGISVKKVRYAVHHGMVPYVQPDSTGPWLLDVRDLDNFIEQNKRTR